MISAESAYIDTSVLGAYYCPEPLSAAAEDAIKGVKSPIISNLSEVEFHSLIAKKRRLKQLSETRARAILDLFGNHVSEGYYRRMALGNEHFARARQLIGLADSALHALDALHLAAAVTENVAIVTSDQKVHRAARRHKLGVVMVS